MLNNTLTTIIKICGAVLPQFEFSEEATNKVVLCSDDPDKYFLTLQSLGFECISKGNGWMTLKKGKFRVRSWIIIDANYAPPLFTHRLHRTIQ